MCLRLIEGGVPVALQLLSGLRWGSRTGTVRVHRRVDACCATCRLRQRGSTMAGAERRRPIPIRTTLDIRRVPKFAQRETEAHLTRAPASPSDDGTAHPAEWKTVIRTDRSSITRTSDLHAKKRALLAGCRGRRFGGKT